MPKPIDLKFLVKQVVDDPEGDNKPTLPSTAKIIGNAIGHQGNWTGVYGHSERSIAIYGESIVYAGFFQGDVYINGNLTVESGDIQIQGHSISKLVRRIAELEASRDQLMQRIDELESSRGTQMGRPLERPSTRPNIKVTELQKSGSNNATFLVSGSAFGSARHLIFSVFNNTTKSNVTLIGELNDIQDIGNSTIIANGKGNLVADKRFQIQCSAGDMLSFSATDGRADFNDLTKLLWSNTETIPVSS
jgi:hypothetical protein